MYVYVHEEEEREGGGRREKKKKKKKKKKYQYKPMWCTVAQLYSGTLGTRI